MIEESGLVVHDIACKLHVARLAAAHGRIDEALSVLEQAERQGKKNRYRRQIATALNDRVRLLILRGETVLARHVLNARGVNESWLKTADAGRIACEMEHVALARLLIAESRPDEALKVLDDLSEKLRHDGRLRRLAQVRTLASIAAFRMGDGLATLAAIIDAVDICQRQGALRTLIDEGEQLREVLRFGREKMPSWQSRGDVAAYLDKIIGASRLAEPPRRNPASRPQFSTKETEVVRHLTGGLSNRDLAAAMTMAPDTVKWHLKNIFGKLGVNNRTQAVLRLREMGFSNTPERR
jgi:LuxR family maltose regulon positive regulatory protein